MIGKLATLIFNMKAKAVMMTTAKNPPFKSALEDYAEGAKEFRKKLKDDYGVGDVNDIPRF
jgi:hypothetical protein